MTNAEIKAKAKGKGVTLWQIADRLGISEPTMTRKMRHELPEAEQTRILSIIDDIATENEARIASLLNDSNEKGVK